MYVPFDSNGNTVHVVPAQHGSKLKIRLSKRNGIFKAIYNNEC